MKVKYYDIANKLNPNEYKQTIFDYYIILLFNI